MKYMIKHHLASKGELSIDAIHFIDAANQAIEQSMYPCTVGPVGSRHLFGVNAAGKLCRADKVVG